MRYCGKLRHPWLQRFCMGTLLWLVWSGPIRECRGQFCTSPIITKQPTSVIVLAGDPASFSIGVLQESCLLTYRWVFGGIIDIFRGSNSTLTVYHANSHLAGFYQVVVSNFSGVVTSSVVTLGVVSGPYPARQTVGAGSNATFAVSVNGVVQSATTYQWQFNENDLPGEINSTLTVSNVQSFNAGAYRVLVSSSAGSVTSSNAILSVAPYLGCAHWGTNGFHFRVTGSPCSNYVIQASSDFQVWDNLSTNTAPASGSFEFIDFDAFNSTERLYRVLQP